MREKKKKAMYNGTPQSAEKTCRKNTKGIHDPVGMPYSKINRKGGCTSRVGGLETRGLPGAPIISSMPGAAGTKSLRFYNRPACSRSSEEEEEKR